ncbi:MAG: transcription antitermination factor NusB [Alphaproteobacteria bacterium]
MSAELRSAARLAAVQALYQLEMTGADAADVVEEFQHHRNEKDAVDEAFFTDIVHGVVKHQTEVDRALAHALAQGWTLARIDSILRALLRSAAYELIARPDVPAKVIMNEYIELTRDFFDRDEPGFVNAVLDRLAHEKRVAELGGRSAI